MEELSDKEIIRRVLEGDIEAFSFIVRKYSQVIAAYISKRLFDKNVRDDLVQNTFLSFYKSVGRFDISRSVLPYLFRIAQNELKMYFRTYKSTIQIDKAFGIGKEDRYDFEEDDYTNLFKFISPESRKALQLLYEGYSYREISTKLKKPLNTIKTLIRRARLELITEYEKTGR